MARSVIKWASAFVGGGIFAVMLAKFGWLAAILTLLGEGAFSIYGTFEGQEGAEDDASGDDVSADE